MVPLQSTEDGQVYVFSTMSVTGLRAAPIGAHGGEGRRPLSPH
jgi:hypothetical protein